MASTKQGVAVVGAGIIGRLLAWQLKRSGMDVTLYERSASLEGLSASAAAGGLLTPLQESIFSRSPAIWDMGHDAVKRWQGISDALGLSQTVKHHGALVVASGDKQVSDMAVFADSLKYFGLTKHAYQINTNDLFDLEPGLKGGYVTSAFHIPSEGSVDTDRALQALVSAFSQSGGKLQLNTEVTAIHDGKVMTESNTAQYQHVYDCRGLGAKKELPDLRPVRGELIIVRRPELTLSRPLRLLNYRYPIYIVPRSAQRFALGATQLESASLGPVTVQSALELLYSAWQVHPEFRYAEITELKAQCRPTLSSDLPVITKEDRVTRINGLYRHGFLLAPYLAEKALEWN